MISTYRGEQEGNSGSTRDDPAEMGEGVESRVNPFPTSPVPAFLDASRCNLRETVLSWARIYGGGLWMIPGEGGAIYGCYKPLPCGWFSRFRKERVGA